MRLETYHYTDRHRIAIPKYCRDLRVVLTGDDEGPEFHVYSKEFDLVEYQAEGMQTVGPGIDSGYHGPFISAGRA